MSLKVLIADHDWRFAQQASAYLESHAHLVVRHSRGPQALAHAEHWRPDLVILSAEMVDSDEGLTKAFYKIKPRPAILLTGWMDRYDRLWRAWQSGGDELLVKPVLRSSELLEAVVTALENAAAGVRKPKPITASA